MEKRFPSQPAGYLFSRFGLLTMLAALLLAAWYGQVVIVVLLGLVLSAAGIAFFKQLDYSIFYSVVLWFVSHFIPPKSSYCLCSFLLNNCTQICIGRLLICLTEETGRWWPGTPTRTRY